MNTNQLKRFAQEARLKMVSLVTAKLDYVLHTDSAFLREKEAQVKTLKAELQKITKAQLIDKVAYTWFNRLVALRFMDVNGYQPIKLMVVTPKDNYTLPEVLDEAKQGNISDELPVDTKHIFELLDGTIRSTNAQNEAYAALLIGACNHLNTVFPFLFEKINDYAELLLPDDLTSEFSIVQDIRNGISAEDCTEVEIIGWIYQFYISQRKDEVFAAKGKVKKEDIPAATQLFTPRWIVEYMVQNSVGKLWLQNRPQSALRDLMPYYIESPATESDDYLKINSVEDITLLDQACGSGHILVYGFELLCKIYEEEGYNPSEIPQLIIEKNLYGFEIDERAAQLAGFALMMKARQYQRRVFRKQIVPNILCYQDLKLTTDEVKTVFKTVNLKLTDALAHDLNNIQQATNLGSLIVPHTSNTVLAETLETLLEKQNNADFFLQDQLQQLITSCQQLVALSKKYHCVVDNPPYMGSGKMNKTLADFVKTNYPVSKADLMTCFMEAGLKVTMKKGFVGMINLPSWLFLSSFDNLRDMLIKDSHIESLLHMGRGVFGVDWGSTAFVIKNSLSNSKGSYFKLHKRNFQHIYPEDIRDIFLKAKNNSETKINFDRYRETGDLATINELIDSDGLQISYKANQIDFSQIPGSPIGYWVSPNIYKAFKYADSLENFSKARIGMMTTDNVRFTRYWNEQSLSKIGFEIKSKEESIESRKKWFPYNKGGDYRKWYGNNELVVNWQNGGEEIIRNGMTSFRGKNYYFQKGITWSFISSRNFGVRQKSNGFIFDIGGSSAFPDVEDLNIVTAFLCGNISNYLLKILNPTFNVQANNINSLPYFPSFRLDESSKENINYLTESSIQISKNDWDSRECSWDFQQNELIKHQADTLEESYDLYQQYWTNKFFQLHKNEEELNKQFIDIYGLQDELTPDIPLQDITILKEETDIVNGELVFNAKEVLIQFISYAVGCMFGRYSLDKEGLILANQGEILEDYLKAVSLSAVEVSFLPDDDDIIPILDDEWFEDDIVGRFYEFLKITFGSTNFEKNLAFVEDCIGKDIRKFFVKDFYNDHIKRYKKRPIYWMFSSTKGTFNVLIYMHRYTPDTLNQILNGYLVEYREKLNTRMEHLNHLIESGTSSEQTKAAKEKDKLKAVLLELQEYEREVLYPLATERISIDLDDGVLVNYNKFGKAIKEIKGLNDKKAKDKVLKFDWIDTTTIK